MLKALQLFRDEGITSLVHCGDMVNGTTAKQMSGFDIIYVNGNMDDSAEAVNDALWKLNSNNKTPGAFFSGKLGMVKIGVTHGHLPGKLEQLIRSGRHTFVLTGHTHRKRDEIVGKTRVINPGALGGVHYGERTVCIIDLDNQDVNFMKVSDW